VGGLLLTSGLVPHPNWRDYRLALVVAVGWAAVTMTINQALGTNYGYLLVVVVLAGSPGPAGRSFGADHVDRHVR
jgi:hypothetical protein